ncbi:MAG: fibronectin type III-like domain-contianing protein [Acidimicrobiia bacterium]|nr:fibronectin type III-like domain-contianing protein [Acidimicrobiia bacterium]
MSGDSIRVTATLCNEGARPGSDVVQVYSRRLEADLPARLVGFARRDLAPGESAEVVIEVPVGRLAERDVDAHAMLVRPGSYGLRVARCATDPGIVCTVVVPG